MKDTKSKIKNKLTNIAVYCVSLPFVIIAYGFILSILLLPILGTIWLVKQLF